MSLFAEIEAQLDAVMRRDRHRLSQRLRSIRRDAKSRKPTEGNVERLREQVAKSVSEAERRRAGLPTPAFDDTLPISARRDEIRDAIRNHQVVVVCGETGSGKSTQLPKICLELGRGILGVIGHTQPRRIAARSIATRIAEELSVPLGHEVGFKMRFTDSTSPKTYIKLMTDGILLAETQGDSFLEQYDTIILDEAHERSLNIDFLIGYLKRLLPKRPDLKVIITSATIDAERFAEHFTKNGAAAPIVEVSGRTFPVELRYRPLIAEGDDDLTEGYAVDEETDWLDGVLLAVDELARIDYGDMLIFMPTERDIHETAKSLRGFAIPGDTPGKETEILPLYARLPGKEQQKVFHPGGRRRIVIATNVAESSLTVPRIRYVIDPGTARVSRYSARTKTQRLPIEPISKASADQRTGRCGRVGPGICVRLYSEEDYENREPYTPPEIRRSNLASVILQAMSLRLGNLAKFPFLDPPRTATIRDGYKTLFELGAIDEGQRITEVGRRLSRLPVDPRIGRMILAAEEEGCLSDVLIIASVLEIRDPRDRPVERQETADERHAQFLDEESDFLTYLNLWDFHHDLKPKLSRNQLRKACRQNFLNYNRMREWLDIHRQLQELSRQAGLRRGRRDTARRDTGAIHRAILAGLLANVANRTGAFDYTVAGGTKFQIWPGSVMFRKKPKWLMAAELVETGRRYLRTCARINPDWVEPLAEHLVKRTYSDPHFSGKAGSAMAFERVTLFGLIIVPRRRVSLGSIDPVTARELLIRDGLVEGELRSNAPFYRHNRELVDEMERLQKKVRRHGLLRGPWSQIEFYEERIPEDVVDAVRLEKWRKTVEQKRPRLLFMSQEDLLEEGEGDVEAAAFPDSIETGTLELPLEYQFELGADNDGVSLSAPLETISQLDPTRLGWLVPGLLEQKIAALIKALPKPIRRELVPAPATARQVVSDITFGEGDLLVTLSKLLGRIAGQPIAPSDFDLDRVPPELRMHIRVIDADGKTVTEGRDLLAIRRELGTAVSERLATFDDPQWNRDGLTGWDFDALPAEVRVDRGGIKLTCYPALVDRRESVSLRLTDTPERAEAMTRRAVARLFYFTAKSDLKSQIRWLPDIDPMTIHAASLPDFDLRREIAELLAARAMDPCEMVPRTQEEFQAAVAQSRERIGLAVQDVSGLLPKLMESYHLAKLAIEQARSPRWQYARADMESQMAELIAPGFLTATPWPWLQHYPRFLQAISARIDRLRSGSLARDRESCEEIQSHWEAYQRRREDDAMLLDPELEHLRWMLEEYRVSLFAQKLGTSIPVSAKRIERQWEKIEQAGR